jgi:transposase-like protein
MPKRTRKSKPATKKKRKKTLTRAERTALLTEAQSKNGTAAQIARKAGVSKWTVYGWRQAAKKSGTVKGTGPKVTGSTRKATRRAQGSTPRALDLRGMIAEIVREELAGLIR